MPSTTPNRTTLNLELTAPVARLVINRPEKANAMNLAFWEEFPAALREVGSHPKCRVLIVSGAGRHFSAGIDTDALVNLARIAQAPGGAARGREAVHAFIQHAQAAFNAIETLRVPVIAAIHGACVGAGVDLASSCDLRLCSADAHFCVKEVDLAVVPDVGTLHRLPHLIGYGRALRLCYTAEKVDGATAERIGLVEQVFADHDALMAGATALAQTIAAKSPLTVRGIKRNALFARDHSVADGLAYTAAWNASTLVSNDAIEAMSAYTGKRAPNFKD
ncbi:MAG: crotonase/enoyl-CoA hydratase family protein [Nevskiaceae bacterium]|nr:MAG: crotonase/enoyl-CoA hydratase family protein [Nevskiaceae bacterium]TBR72729.1 MAG: crotonase/enoyl-CoA hydratase family protein [Nevskiaceae bacterium]